MTERRAAESPPRSRPSRTSLHPIRWWSVGLAIVCGRRSRSLPREDTVVSALKRRSIDRDFPERGSQRFDRRRSPLQKQRSIEQCHLAIRPFLSPFQKGTEHRSRPKIVTVTARLSPPQSNGASIATVPSSSSRHRERQSPLQSNGASIAYRFYSPSSIRGAGGVLRADERLSRFHRHRASIATSTAKVSCSSGFCLDSTAIEHRSRPVYLDCQ